MEVIGTGFLAGSLRRISARHEGVVALAAGVSDIAGADPVRDFRREARLVAGTAAQCKRRGRKLLFFSTASASVYGAPGCTGTEECAHPATTPYGRHKRMMEGIVREAGCDWLILRLSHVVGPGQAPHQLVPALTRQILGGRVHVYRGACRDILDVRDFLDATDSLLAAGASREVVNVASGVPVPVEDMVTHIGALLGREPEREYVRRDHGHRVSVRKLDRMLGRAPGTAPAAPYRDVLDRYVPGYALPPAPGA
ncbi:NAD-dependent epimerase/dehydratase family protein [Streptomyces sp. XH2]|uniref:NAD-dependent epimerase/dehydratase family protein n=1 Tax=Streptomyces sp. XH2 TaxID=3412483 RepID=UPI003C7C7C4D